MDQLAKRSPMPYHFDRYRQLPPQPIGNRLLSSEPVVVHRETTLPLPSPAQQHFGWLNPKHSRLYLVLITDRAYAQWYFSCLARTVFASSVLVHPHCPSRVLETTSNFASYLSKQAERFPVHFHHRFHTMQPSPFSIHWPLKKTALQHRGAAGEWLR